jgi:hypothetical protein
LIAYTNKDYASLRDAMLDLARERLPEWTDHSPNDLGVLLVELFAGMGDVLVHYIDRTAGESYPETALERRSVIHLLRLIGYELRAAVPASADLTLLFEPAPEPPEAVMIETGAGFTTTAKATGTPVAFQYVRDPLSVNLLDLPVITHEDGKAYRILDRLPVVQTDAAYNDEVLGSSDGSAGQRFRIPQRPVIESSLIVTVDEGAGARIWDRQASLLNSLAMHPHYVLRRDEAEAAWVEFGDGKYGRIPARGRNNIRASFRTGGGARGNVPALTITKPIADIDHLKLVYNRAAASGAADPEPVEAAALRAPRQFRSMGRAVTAGDYEAHASVFGVGKARARAGAWNRVELFVAPTGGGYPTDTLKEDLRAYFESKRMMTSVLSIRDPEYVKVFIEGDLDVESYYYADQTEQRVQNAVLELLAFDRVRFGDRLHLSKFYEAVEKVDGVRSVEITGFARAGGATGGTIPGTLYFDWHEIPVAGDPEGIRLRVTGGQRAP